MHIPINKNKLNRERVKNCRLKNKNVEKLNWIDLNKSTQLLSVFIGHARYASRLHIVLIGCSQSRTVSARLVLNACTLMRPFTLELAND